MKKLEQKIIVSKSSLKVSILIFLGIAIWQPAIAANPVDASMSGKAFIDTRTGSTKICGITIASTGSNGTGDEGKLISAGILVNKAIISVKLIGLELPAGKTGVKQLVPKPIFGGWLKAKGKDKASSIPPFYDKPAPTNSKFFRVDYAAGQAVIDAISTKDEIQIGVSWQPGIETIYSGQVEIKETEIAKFNECLSQILAVEETPSKSAVLPISTKLEAIIQSVISANGGYINKELHQEFWKELAKGNQDQAIQDINWAKANILLMQEFQKELWESALISYRNQKIVKTQALIALETKVPVDLIASIPYRPGSKDFKSVEAIVNGRLSTAMENSKKLLVASAQHTDFLGIQITEEYLLRILNNIDGGMNRVRMLLNKDWKDSHQSL